MRFVFKVLKGLCFRLGFDKFYNFINPSNDFLGYKRAMRVSKKEINKSAMSYFPPASKAC